MKFSGTYVRPVCIEHLVTGCSGNLFEVKTILFAISIWYRALFLYISLTKTLWSHTLWSIRCTFK